MELLFRSLVLLSFVCPAWAHVPKINYLIKKGYNQENCVEIIATLPANSNQEIAFIVPEGITECDANIEDLHNITRYDSVFYVKNVKDKIELKYPLCADPQNTNIDKPIIKKEFMHLLGQSSFVLPYSPKEQNFEVAIDLEGFEEDKIYTSLTQETAKLSFIDSVYKLNNFVILAGNFKTDIFKVGQRSIYLNFLGSFSDSYLSLKEDLLKIMHQQKNFWQDNEQKPLLITLVAPNSINSVLGRHFYNEVAFSMSEQRTYKDFLHDISHELTHEWIGWKIPVSHDKNGWFVEGFNDYYSLRFVYESKVYNELDYINYMNYVLQYYYSHPLKNISSAEIAEKFFHDPEYSNINMLRGFLLAHCLEEVANIENSPNYIDLLVQHLIKNQVQHEHPITTEELLSGFQQIVGVEIWKEVDQILLAKKPLPLPKEFLNKRSKLFYKEIEYPFFDFDLETFFRDHKITNLHNKSNAYVAGLREGMIVIEHDLKLNRFGQPSYVVVHENGQNRKISFNAEKRKKIVPQYQLNN